MKLGRNATKVKKALNAKGYELIKYSYDPSADDGWCLHIEFERIEKTPILPYICMEIVEWCVANVMIEIEELPDLTDPVTLQALIDKKEKIW